MNQSIFFFRGVGAKGAVGVGAEADTDFDQTDFGLTDFGQKIDRLWPTLIDRLWRRLWQNRLWPKLVIQFFPSFSNNNQQDGKKV